MTESVSILIVTRDRREMLDALLSDLVAQDYRGTIEIVVVEETDTPREIAGVVYVPHPVRNRGIAYARNLSVQHASHDLLVFVDDDCRVAPDWLGRLVAPFEDSTVLGVQGGVSVPEDTNAIGWAETLLGFPGGGYSRVVQAKGQLQETKEVSTLNAAYRKAAVVEAGGFSDRARFGGEDFLLAKRVAEQGRLLFVPEAMVKHAARESLPAIWCWFIRRGRAEYELWHHGIASEGFGYWMLRASLGVKLIPLLLLCYWSFWPLLLFLALMVTVNLWRFRWVPGQADIPSAAWWLLPWLRMYMSLASDVGRVKSWMGRP